jgi:hypothetical protein
VLQSDQNTGVQKLSTTKNPKVRAGVIREAGTERVRTPEQTKEMKVGRMLSKSNSFTKLTDILAQDFFCVRNQPIEKAKAIWPDALTQWRMHFADLFYPHAEGGPLYIDQPSNDDDIAMCEAKLVKLREHGIRYTYTTAKDDEATVRMRMEARQ